MAMGVSRFEVYLVNLDPMVDKEIQKTRLARKLGLLEQDAQKQVLTMLARMFAL